MPELYRTCLLYTSFPVITYNVNNEILLTFLHSSTVRNKNNRNNTTGQTVEQKVTIIFNDYIQCKQYDTIRRLFTFKYSACTTGRYPRSNAVWRLPLADMTAAQTVQNNLNSNIIC